MYADVYRGLTPVSGVNVSGIIEMPDGSTLVVPLLDGGSGKIGRASCRERV